MLTLYPMFLSVFFRLFHKKTHTDGLSGMGDGFILLLMPIVLLGAYVGVSALLFGVFSTDFLTQAKIAGTIIGIGLSADVCAYWVCSLKEEREGN